MNKYALIISVVATVGGVSNVFAEDSPFDRDSFAYGLAIGDFISRPQRFNFELPTKKAILRHIIMYPFGPASRLAVCLAAYSQAEKLYYGKNN